MSNSPRPATGREKTFSRERYEGEVDRIAFSVAERFGRGNVALQLGNILTAEQLEREREARRVLLEHAGKSCV